MQLIRIVYSFYMCLNVICVKACSVKIINFVGYYFLGGALMLCSSTVW